MHEPGSRAASVKAITLLLLAAFFWALPPVLGKHVAFVVPPAFTTLYRLLLSSVLFLPLVLRRENLARMRRIDRRTAGLLVLSGCVFFGPHYIYYFLSLQYTHATHASILLQTGYIFSALFCLAFLKEPRTPARIAGICLSAAGILVVLLEQVLAPGEGSLPAWSVVLGGLLMVGSQVSWAAYATLNKKYLATTGPVPSNFINFLLGSLAVLPLAAPAFPLVPSFTIDVHLVLVLIALCGSFLGYLFYNEGLKDMDGSKASMILLVNPIFAVLLSMIFLGETVSVPFIVGSAIIMASLVLVTSERKNRCPAPAPAP